MFRDQRHAHPPTHTHTHTHTHNKKVRNKQNPADQTFSSDQTHGQTQAGSLIEKVTHDQTRTPHTQTYTHLVYRLAVLLCVSWVAALVCVAWPE
jgi:hypothetical protein